MYQNFNTIPPFGNPMPNGMGFSPFRPQPRNLTDEESAQIRFIASNIIQANRMFGDYKGEIFFSVLSNLFGFDEPRLPRLGIMNNPAHFYNWVDNAYGVHQVLYVMDTPHIYNVIMDLCRMYRDTIWVKKHELDAMKRRRKTTQECQPLHDAIQANRRKYYEVATRICTELGLVAADPIMKYKSLLPFMDEEYSDYGYDYDGFGYSSYNTDPYYPGMSYNSQPMNGMYDNYDYYQNAMGGYGGNTQVGGGRFQEWMSGSQNQMSNQYMNPQPQPQQYHPNPNMNYNPQPQPQPYYNQNMNYTPQPQQAPQGYRSYNIDPTNGQPLDQEAFDHFMKCAANNPDYTGMTSVNNGSKSYQDAEAAQRHREEVRQRYINKDTSQLKVNYVNKSRPLTDDEKIEAILDGRSDAEVQALNYYQTQATGGGYSQEPAYPKYTEADPSEELYKLQSEEIGYEPQEPAPNYGEQIDQLYNVMTSNFNKINTTIDRFADVCQRKFDMYDTEMISDHYGISKEEAARQVELKKQATVPADDTKYTQTPSNNPKLHNSENLMKPQ